MLVVQLVSLLLIIRILAINKQTNKRTNERTNKQTINKNNLICILRQSQLARQLMYLWVQTPDFFSVAVIALDPCLIYDTMFRQTKEGRTAGSGTSLPQSLRLQYNVILDRVITTPDCSLFHIPNGFTHRHCAHRYVAHYGSWNSLGHLGDTFLVPTASHKTGVTLRAFLGLLRKPCLWNQSPSSL